MADSPTTGTDWGVVDLIFGTGYTKRPELAHFREGAQERLEARRAATREEDRARAMSQIHALAREYGIQVTVSIGS